MVTNPSLLGKKVLVTRPEKQAGQLVTLINSEGGKEILFPVIEIRTIPPEQWAAVSLQQQTMLIFVSRNAVESFCTQANLSISTATRLVAVGDGTAETMRKNGLRVDIQPEKSIGSEGLLSVDAMQNVAHQNICIVRGQGGRELLADTLRLRGANISYIEVYERCLPTTSKQNCEAAMLADFVICTSVAGVSNLCSLLESEIVRLKQKPLVVLSKRIEEYASSLGFTDVFTTEDASDHAILKCLMEIKNNHGK